MRCCRPSSKICKSLTINQNSTFSMIQSLTKTASRRWSMMSDCKWKFAFSGGRKGMACIAVFDVHRKCFVAEIPVRVQGAFQFLALRHSLDDVQGRVKMLFALPTPSTSGGTSFVVTSQSEDYGSVNLNQRLEQDESLEPTSCTFGVLNCAPMASAPLQTRDRCLMRRSRWTTTSLSARCVMMSPNSSCFMAPTCKLSASM